jgi:hypothetical protein
VYVRVVFMTFTIDAESNFHVNTHAHENSCARMTARRDIRYGRESSAPRGSGMRAE